METYNFFKRTKVNCALAPREMSMTELTDVVNNTFSSGAYTHHQKSVIADAPGAYGPQKRLVAFVGGLDLTGGRWDTPDHELFSTLLNEHDGDFRNSNAKSVPQHQGNQSFEIASVSVELDKLLDCYCNIDINIKYTKINIEQNINYDKVLS